MQTWLITGGNGLLGSWCVREARRLGHHVVATHSGHEALDIPGVTWQRVNLEDERRVDALVDQVQPRVVIHTAAMAQPPDCEADKARATTMNTLLPAWIATGCARVGARMVHVSTDLVFAGDAGPYVETDEVRPISHYGVTKVEAEREVRQALPDHAIVRTSLIMGPSPRGDRGVEEAIHATLKAGKSPRLFVDEYRSPTSAADLAAVLVALGAHPFQGTLHVAGTEVFSRFTLGALAALQFGFDVRQLTADTVKNAAGTVPPRAPNTTLDTRKMRALSPSLPRLRSMAEVLRDHPLARPIAAR